MVVRPGRPNRRRIGAENRERGGIHEDDGVIPQLMLGPPACDTLGGKARAPLVHANPAWRIIPEASIRCAHLRARGGSNGTKANRRGIEHR
jgi:hypothetical protein